MDADPWNEFQNHVLNVIKTSILQLDDMLDENSLNKMISEKKVLKEPQNSEFGDLSTPIAFIIGKKRQKFYIGFIVIFIVSTHFTWKNPDGSPEGIEWFNMLVYSI